MPSNHSTAVSGTDPSCGLPLIFGHQAGLFFLFFTEMWERFSYYGMRALLVLFLVSELQVEVGVGRVTRPSSCTACIPAWSI